MKKGQGGSLSPQYPLTLGEKKKTNPKPARGSKNLPKTGSKKSTSQKPLSQLTLAPSLNGQPLDRPTGAWGGLGGFRRPQNKKKKKKTSSSRKRHAQQYLACARRKTRKVARSKRGKNLFFDNPSDVPGVEKKKKKTWLGVIQPKKVQLGVINREFGGR